MANKKTKSSKNVNNNKQKQEKPSNYKVIKPKKVKKEKKPINKKRLAIIICSAVLALVVLAGAAFGIWYAIYGRRFDYLTGDIEKYITISKSDYSGYVINVTVPEPTELDVEERILQTLAEYKSTTPKNNGYYFVPDYSIANGWKVKIWYRGYTLDESGNKVDLDGTSNLSSSSAAELEIGSGDFVSGFEISLIGKNISDYSKLTSFSTGAVREGDIVILNMDAMLTDAPAQRYQNLQIDLSASDVNEKWGEGFREAILEMQVGATRDEALIARMPNGFDAVYQNITVNSAIRPTLTYTEGSYVNGEIITVEYTVIDAEGESKPGRTAFTLDEGIIGGSFGGALREMMYTLLGGGELGVTYDVSKTDSDTGYVYSSPRVVSVEKPENKPIVVDAHFPYDYSEESLRGLSVKFDVYVVEAVVYDAPELNDEFITSRLKLTEADLAYYEGETLSEKYRDMVTEQITNEYYEAYESQVEELVWTHLMSAVEYDEDNMPRGELRAVMNEYIEDFEAYCELYSGQYESVELAACDYFEIADGSLWRDFVRNRAAQDIVRRMIMYYVARTENFMPEDENISIVDLYNTKIDEVLVDYLEYKGCTPDKYSSTAEYDAAVSAYRQEIIDLNGEQTILESVYYAYIMPKIIELAVVEKP